MSGKFHISKDGVVRPCHATIRPCRLNGGQFNSIVQAESYQSNKEIQDERYNNLIQNGVKFTREQALERGEYVEDLVNKAYENGLSTDKLHGKVKGNKVTWSRKRTKLHKRLLEEMYEKYKNVPSEGKVIMSAGLPGAGKTTVLRNNMNIDMNNYATISSDDFKELLAEKGHAPKVDGLTSMELSPLLHTESSYLADKLLTMLSKESKNVIYDFTCKNEDTSLARINTLVENDYKEKDIQLVFVNIPLSIAHERAENRYYVGLNGNLETGGRHLPPRIINESKAPEGSLADSNNALVVAKLSRDLNIATPRIFDNSGKFAIEIHFQDFIKSFYKS